MIALAAVLALTFAACGPSAPRTDSSAAEKPEAGAPPAALSVEWLEDYPKAHAIAAETGRAMLLDFTGSDWCVWCQKLDKEIFETDAFQSYAKDNLVLVKLDFPRARPMPASIKAQNNELQQKYAVQGFPTVLILDSKENKLGALGYMEGGPGPFIAEVKKLLKTSAPSGGTRAAAGGES